MESITISIDRKNKSVVCQSNASPTIFDDTEIYLFGDFYTEEGLPASEKDIFACYTKFGKRTYDYLDGIGAVFIYDHNIEKIEASSTCVEAFRQPC